MQKDHLEILLEDIRGKFDLVLEGHEVLRSEIRETRTELKKDIELSNFKIDILNKKIDGVAADLNATDQRLSGKIDAVDEKLSKKIDAVDEKLSKKIDAVEKNLSQHISVVAADLKSHRADTEAHHGGVYLVKES